MEPQVSVIVPTHNRAPRLGAALEALSRQDWPAAALEAVIVADGCTDQTADVFARWNRPFRARLVQQAASGPAAARNRGAAEARGRYLVFLDDDILASPGLVRAHVEAHSAGSRQVVIGYLPARVNNRDFFSIALRGWWDAMFQEMWKPGHRFTFRDLLSGNFSLEREFFETAGGFETALRCHEDYELGLRLLEAGARFRFAPRALGIHDERTTLALSLKRKFEEGRADMWLLADRPRLFEVLPIRYIQASSRRLRLLRWLAVRSPRAGDALAWVLRQRLRWYERLRLRYRWRATLEDLLIYWYWRGLVVAAGGAPDLSAMRRRAAPDPADEVVDIDLAGGVEAAELRLDRERPAAVRLRHGASLIGEVPAAGAEYLRGVHLRLLLAEPFIERYTRALAIAGELPPVVDVTRVLAECRPPETPSLPTQQAGVPT
ncbi:MAG: glycosyltransferase family 2 protein [Acidobacteria bacterium]|nr:glycosyltransferase family 2 protein [Acidobacteriota bacterium]